MEHMHKYKFIWGIKENKNFVFFEVLAKTTTNPKSIEPKLKNFTAVVPVFVDFMHVVKKIQAQKSENVKKIIFIIVNIYLKWIERNIYFVKEIIENENKV